MTTSQLSRLADLRDRFRGSTLVVPTPARIHGAEWVVKSVVLGVNAVVAYPKDTPNEPQMVDFGDVFLPGDTMWRQRGGRGSSEAGWTSQNEASALVNQRRQAPRVGPVDHLDLGICGCEGLQSEDVCQRRAPLGLVAHPAGGEKTLRCQRFQAELEERRIAEEAAPKPVAKPKPLIEGPKPKTRSSRALYVATPGLMCSRCGRADGAKLSGANGRIKVDPETGICSLHHGGHRAEPSAPGEQRLCTKCGALKDAAADFSLGQSWCRECIRAYDHDRYVERGDRRKPAGPAEQDKALPPAAPAASSAPAETPEKGLPEPAALTAPAQPAVTVAVIRQPVPWLAVEVRECTFCGRANVPVNEWCDCPPSLAAQASFDQSSGFQPSFEAPKPEPEAPVGGSLLDQIDQLIRERRQLLEENADLRARLEVADDLERQLAGIRDRVERELANV